MFISPRSLAHPFTGLAALVLATPVLAQVTITCDQAQVTSRVPCVLTAAHADGKPRTWKWSVVGLEDSGQLLEAIAPDKVRVRTPVTLVERSFTVLAEDSQNPSVTGTFVLRITPNPQPGSGERALAQGLFPSAFTPSLVPFKGHPEQLKTHYDPLAPGKVHKIAFCDDAAMGALDRCWIVAKVAGLEAYKVAGDPVAIPGFPLPGGNRTCLAVATLPPGPGEVPADAPRVVYVEETRTGEEAGIRVFALEPDGRSRLLAGGAGWRSANGRGEAARFSGVLDLALDRKGNVYVCESWEGIRKISLDRTVSTLAPKDAGRGGASPERSRCLTVDPATGDLYVAVEDRLVRITPDGTCTLVIGGQHLALASGTGYMLAPLRPGRVPLDTRFAGFHPTCLALHGRELFMLDVDGIDAFHLDTRRLARIVPSASGLRANRLGPLHYLNPHLRADQCAAVELCEALALTKEAMGLVAVGQGLAELELPDDPVTAIMDPPRRASVERKESKEDLAAEGGPALDNLWPGQPLETGTVRADGLWGATHWRNAGQDQRFTGSCWVEARGLTSGWAQISLVFLDGAGKELGHSHPMGTGMPDVVSSPAHGRTLLRMTGTAPPRTDRVGLCLRVVKGNPGAVVTFHDVTFHQLP